MSLTAHPSAYLFEQYKLNKKMSDKINPEHYKVGWIETIDYLQAKLNVEWFEGYLVGNILKYVSRYNHKNWLEDLKKSKWYINKLIEVKWAATNK